MMAVTHPSAYSQSPSSVHNFMNNGGVFMHSNPPKPLMSSSSSTSSTQNTAIRNMVKSGDVDKLENIVLEGQGARLLGMIDSAPDMKVKTFLRGIPGYMAKVDLIHDAVIRGSVRELQTLLDKKKLSQARDAVGRGLAHKAVLHSQKNVLEWLGKKYPEAIHIRDNESRTCLHYCGISKNPPDVYNSLLNLGANAEVIDIHGRKASYYLTNPQELYIEGIGDRGGNARKSFRNSRFSRGRRISPISPKSSPSPPVTTMASQPTRSSAGATVKPPQYSLNSCTRAQIRIWIHEKDISKLEKIVWSGNGDKLLLETTNNPKVRRFLDNVPYLLHNIKLIHTAAIHNDVDGLKEIRSRIEQSGNNNSLLGVSIANELFTARDAYGLSALHKATGLNNRGGAEYLLYEFGNSLDLQDNFNRTALHYAAARESNDQSSSESIYKFLIRAGADESVQDYKHHVPEYYVSHSNECDSFKFLRNIPDAPRVVTQDKGLIGWDRSGVLRVSPVGGKRKISSGDEFSGSVQETDPVERGSSNSKLARTEEDVVPPVDEDDIQDVGDAYVADSDEGKYELNDDVDIRGEIEEEEEEAQEPQPNAEDLTEPPQVDVEENNTQVYEDPEPVEEPKPPSAMEEEPPNVEEDVPQETEEVQQPDEAPPPEPTPEPTPEPEVEPEVVPEAAPEVVPEVAPNEEEPPPEVEEPPPAAEEPPPEETPVEPEPEKMDAEPEEEVPESVPDPEPMEPEATEPEPVEMDNPPEYAEIERESTVEEYIGNADMEALVNMVLKGHGHELTTKTSENPEIQEFLNNVPAYMAKISSIHSAAYTGNMRDLQSLLDRKRLAEAQDSRGRGPLHHAVLGSSPQVVRYLVNGYPHCLNLMDHNKRTALHYAATLQDSGVMYKVLIQAGADPNIRDAQGNTPGIYLRRKDLLKFDDLVGSGSAVSQKIITKKANVDTWERPPTPFPDKRRDGCLESSTAVIHISPPVTPPENVETEQMELPVSNLSLLNSFYLEVLSKESQSIWSRTWKKLTSGNNTSEIANKYVKRYLTPQVFHKVKMRCTPRYSSTLLDCIKFYPQFFIVAPDPHAYTSFSEVFLPAIFDANTVTPFTTHPDMVLQGAIPLSPDYPIVDLPSKFVQLVRVRVSRNIRPFPFIPIMKREHLYEIQKLIRRVFEPELFEWFDLETLEKDERDEVTENRSVWFPEATKISRFWPKGRGFLCNESGSTQIWVNAEDHVDIVIQSQYGKLGPVMEVVQSTVDMVQEYCDFHFNSQCGFLTVDPFRCGTGLKIKLTRYIIQDVGGYDTEPEPAEPEAAEPEPEQMNGVEEEISNMEVEDKVELERTNVNFPAIWSEEGKYLASVLGDALVKGLTLVSQNRPDDPVEYLAKFLRAYTDGEESGVVVIPPAAAGAAVAAAAAAAAATSEEEPEKQPDITEEESKEEDITEETAPPPEEEEPPPPEEPPSDPPEEPENIEPEVAAAETTPPEDAPADPPEVEEPPAETEEAAEPTEAPPPEDPPTEEPPEESPEEEAAPSADPENNLNAEISDAYDKLEESLEEEEASGGNFDPEKEEREITALEAITSTDESETVSHLHNSTRDENGQSVLHFASTRPGGASTIAAFLQNPSVNLAWRDTNMRTARDVANDLGRSENVRVIDNWVISLAQRNEMEVIENLLADGYDHVADIEDAAGTHIVEVAEKNNNKNIALMLRNVPEFREKIDRVHRCIRSGDIDGVKALVNQDKRVAYALNPKTGRCAMHVAVLLEEVPIVRWLGETVPETLKKGDQLERTCLHYAMGVEKVEKIVRILVRAGAKRVVKDLRDRQPSYYFIHRDEITDLQSEERAIVN